MPIETNLNVPPYFDDYDPAKNYHRILFRPSTAVQARELTQVQSILQNQIEKFGNYVFRNGDIVAGCSISDIPSLPYVRLSDFSSNGNLYDVTSLINAAAVSATSNLTARVVHASLGTQSLYPNTAIIYFNYLNTGNNGATYFSNNEQLDFYRIPRTGNNVADLVASVNTYSNVTANTFTIGAAHGIKVSDGIVYLNGNFIELVEPAIGIVEPYQTYAGNNVVGFILNEEIVTENQDTTLLDNALGYSNENAPSAHRLKLTASLIALDPDTAANTVGFNAIASYNYGSLVTKDVPTSNLQSMIGSAIAQRIYDEAGNYVVNPFSVDAISASNVFVLSDSSLFYARIGPGVGYAHGNRVENLKTSYVGMRRGTSTAVSLDQQITFNYGGYFQLTEIAGNFPFEAAQQVILYDTPQQAITTRQFSGLAPTGNNIGTAQMRCFSYLSGQAGTNTAIYLLHLFNISLANTYTTNQIKSVYYNGTVKGVADVYSTASNLLGSPNQIFSSGVNALKALRDSANNINTQYTYRGYANSTMAVDGTVSVTISSSAPGGTDILPYGTGILIDSEASTFTLVVRQAGQTAALSGTVQIFNNSGNVIGSSTSFISDFVIGDLITVGSDTRAVLSITNSTFMFVDTAFSSSLSGQSYVKSYKVGQILPISLTMPGPRYVQITSSTNFVIHTNQAPTGTLSCSVFYDTLRTNVSPAKKQINKNRFVKIDTRSNPTGPWCLGFSDVHKVNAVYGQSTNNYSFSGTNLTSTYSFDTGQKDTHYDLGYLYLKPGASTTNFPYLLVHLDYFTSNSTTGVGFYTIESYPIDDVNTANTIGITTAEMPLYIDSSGNQRPLRNYVDFRPFTVSTANNTGPCDTSNSTQVTAAISYASLNPANTISFSVPTNGLNVPSYSKNFQADYTYYLPRIDLIYFTPTNNFKVKEGLSSLEPQTPLFPEDGMVLATLRIPPYPSLTGEQVDVLVRENAISKNLIRDTSATILTNIVTNRRYTMADIGKLDTRISDLEQYASLTLLQQKATDLTVTDQYGLDRFKNGIFVDPFSDFTFSDVSNPEYSIAIDQRIGVARPRVRRETIDTIYNNSISLNIQKTGRVLSLPYSEVSFITQPYATKYRTLAPGIFMWNGVMTLLPSYDNHYDFTQIGSINITVNQAAPWQQFANTFDGAFYGSWQTTVKPAIVIGTSGSTTTTGTVTESSGGLGIQSNVDKVPDPAELTAQLYTLFTNNSKNIPVENYIRGATSYTWPSTESRGSAPPSIQYVSPDANSYRYI